LSTMESPILCCWACCPSRAIRIHRSGLTSCSDTSICSVRTISTAFWRTGSSSARDESGDWTRTV
jgi:hypothetical protein